MNSAASWQWVSCLRKGPSWRSEADIDIIFSKLKTLKVFEHYPEDILREISRAVRHETFLANETLFRPGEEALYWYAVVSGSVKMFNVDPTDSTKTTLICQLSGGDSFGENVVLGTTRQTLVITADYCELLYLEALQIRRIYEAHKKDMERLLTSRSTAVESENSDTDGPETERDSITPDSDLAMAGFTLTQIIKDHFSTDLIRDHRVYMHTYQNCCSGRRLVEWTINQSSTYRPRPQVIQMWQALVSEGILKHVTNTHPFRDDDQLLYEFVDRPIFKDSRPSRRWSSLLGGVADDKLPNGRPRSSSSIASSPRSSRSSLTSILDECFDTIAALGPEVLIYATLRKDPAERTEEDIELIYEELIHIGAFRHLSNAVKRELSACARLEHFKKAGKYVFREGDKGDSWYVILRGSVNVLIHGKGVVCSLHEGQEFGKLAVVNEAVRSASVQVKENNCYFLSISRSDFKRILLSVESSNIKFTEHGKEVLLLEKARQGRYLVVKGTPEKMLDHLLESEIEYSSHEDTFAQDFFLTYPAFMSISDLCEGLRKRYDGVIVKRSGDTPASSSTEQVKVRKRRVVDAVCVWIRTAKAELVKDMIFLKLLHELQDRIAEDGLANHLTTALADSIKESANRSGGSMGSPLLPIKSKKVSSIEHEIKMGITTVPPMQPQDKIPLRIHTVDHTCCRLQVRVDSTAKAIIKEACAKLQLDPANFNLCEVKSSGEKNPLDDNDISVHSEISVNGRLYIVPKSHSEKTVPPLPDQNQKPGAVLPEKDGAKELAAHLTVYDWNLFSNIQQMEYIYHLFGRHKFNKITTNLDLIIRRFNEVQCWVMTEICREPELIKRVALLKKFIKTAAHCKSFNNMNSFFAIVIGLMSTPVTRMSQTWKELPPRLKTRFEQFQALTDPSRNHKVLRAFQSKLAPPVIPFMPLVTKDAYFLHIGNETFVDGLVNFEKMRLVASNVRGLSVFRSVPLSSDVRLLANKTPATQQYIRTLKVIDNEVILSEMSHKVEPSASARPQSTVT